VCSERATIMNPKRFEVESTEKNIADKALYMNPQGVGRFTTRMCDSNEVEQNTCHCGYFSYTSIRNLIHLSLSRKGRGNTESVERGRRGVRSEEFCELLNMETATESLCVMNCRNYWTVFALSEVIQEKVLSEVDGKGQRR